MASSTRRWSSRVTRESHALSLEPKVFSGRSARSIAASLKRSAERSRARKSAPFRSAMSMLNFYLNRAGARLPEGRRKVLDQAKDELRNLYGRNRRNSHAGKTHRRTRKARSAAR
ncbi:MAG TPA: DUF3175 domain-containing protein [Burkholderiales bacterium]|jgi:hypothetical protein|nr:DUF3175 domain-containing protein [Burkholderiales bacterium]